MQELLDLYYALQTEIEILEEKKTWVQEEIWRQQAKEEEDNSWSDPYVPESGWGPPAVHPKP